MITVVFGDFSLPERWMLNVVASGVLFASLACLLDVAARQISSMVYIQYVWLQETSTAIWKTGTSVFTFLHGCCLSQTLAFPRGE